MNLSSRPRSFAVVLLVMVAFAAFPSTSSASHSWNGYHWGRTSNPFTIQLGDNVSSAWDSYLSTASSKWSVSSVLDTRIVTGGTTARRCRPTAGRVEVCNYTYGNNGWLGLASISLSGGHISQGTAKMNDTYFNSGGYTSVDRNQVMCQEIGHTFGLDHTSTDGSSQQTCMDYSTNNINSQYPNQHDYDELATIYSHNDSTSTVAQMPAEMTKGDFNSRAEWGKSIKKSKDGKQEVFERDFGNGNKMVFFVTWAVSQ